MTGIKNTDLFIRTYRNDLPWLRYCLQSIQRHCTGIRNIIITIPSTDFHLLKEFNLTKEKIFTVLPYKNDYLGQQVSKMMAWNYSDADCIIYVDSDCIFTKPFNPEMMIQDGKPIILKTHYSKVGDAIVWKAPTEKALKYPVEYEFMRRHPSIWYRSDIEAAYHYISDTSGMEAGFYILNQKSFSEFNYLGAYMDKFCPRKYTFVDTDIPTIDTSSGNSNAVHQQFVKQYYSWGGITETIKNEIENYLQ